MNCGSKLFSKHHFFKIAFGLAAVSGVELWVVSLAIANDISSVAIAIRNRYAYKTSLYSRSNCKIKKSINKKSRPMYNTWLIIHYKDIVNKVPTWILKRLIDLLSSLRRSGLNWNRHKTERCKRNYTKVQSTKELTRTTHRYWNRWCDDGTWITVTEIKASVTIYTVLCSV